MLEQIWSGSELVDLSRERTHRPPIDACVPDLVQEASLLNRRNEPARECSRSPPNDPTVGLETGPPSESPDPARGARCRDGGGAPGGLISVWLYAGPPRTGDAGAERMPGWAAGLQICRSTGSGHPGPPGSQICQSSRVRLSRPVNTNPGPSTATLGPSWLFCLYPLCIFLLFLVLTQHNQPL